MALQSEAASPVVGEAHKDTYDGDTKSDEETEEEVDLEEGEILDSGNEGDEEDTAPLPTSPASAPAQAEKQLSSSPLKKFEQIVESAENSLKSKEMPSGEEGEKDWVNDGPPIKFKRKYFDHDQLSDSMDDESREKVESGWYKRLAAKKKQSGEKETLDYRKELELYAGSPSPEREKKSSRKRSRTAASMLKAKARKAAARRAKAHMERKAGGIGKKTAIMRKPCKYYLDGHCSKGSDCPYQHIRPGVRDRKRELCRYYLNGHCSKGRQCTYMHEEFPCKFFHTGAKCFSGENCRFSHEKLTKETEQLLKECLKGYHEERHEERERKRQKSKSPEPPPSSAKRICLLGSPPRHIREAEETKRWQEEMIFLQREKSADFHIRLNSLKPQFASPSKSVTPNFYVDTMQTSPPNHKPPQNNPFQEDPVLPPSIAFQIDNAPCPQKLEDEDLRQPLDWTNIQALVESMNGPKQEPLRDTDERKLAVENESGFKYTEGDGSASDQGDSKDGHGRSPSPQSRRNTSPFENHSSSRSNSPTSNKEPSPKQFSIPTHLPRRQQELMARIQRHQETEGADDKSDDAEKGDSENSVPKTVEVNTKKEIDYETKNWSSSDDDDDDADRLTNVLKKLRQAPPPKLKEVPTQKPSLDISNMLNSMLQKANENKPNRTYQEQGKFWQNILAGTVLSKPLVPASAGDNSIHTCPPPPENRRRVLLPDPKPLDQKPVEKPIPESRDPRLKNRDPGTALPKASLPPPSAMPMASSVPQILPMEAITSNSMPSQHRDITVPCHTAAAVVVDNLNAHIPYKLYPVTCKPVNYSYYVQASHSDPKLLNDPRIRKHLAQEETHTTNQVEVKKEPKENSLPNLLFGNFSLQGLNQTIPAEVKQEPKDNTMPNLLFSNFGLPLQENNIPSSPLPHDVPRLPDLKLPPPSQVPQFSDPRTRRRPSTGNSPPLVPASAETVVTPSAPTIGSHLPRAISDPRMAKLHKPLDPRRPRIASEPSNKTSLASRTQLPAPLAAPTPNSAMPESSSVTVKTEPTESEEDPEKKKEPSKKNKAVHRNRKTSMDYASPLNSCDDNSSGALNYNSYNQRPKNRLRNTGVDVPLPNETLPTPSSLVNALLPDFSASDSSNLDCDSMDMNASVKDKFKTLDPTASPFC